MYNMYINVIYVWFVDKQVFSDLDFLGWYTTGDTPTFQEIQIHKQICQFNECPIMLQMNPLPRKVDVSVYRFWSVPAMNLLLTHRPCRWCYTSLSSMLFRERQQCCSCRWRTRWPLRKPNGSVSIMSFVCPPTKWAKSQSVSEVLKILNRNFVKMGNWFSR